MREFVIQLRKEKIGVKECSLGYRLINILGGLGISYYDDKLKIFLDTFDLCNRLEFNPNIIQECLLEMNRVAKAILPSQMQSYFSRQIEEKNSLDEKIRKLKDIIHKIENTKNDIDKDFALIKDKIGLTSADLDWYSNIKEDLEKEDMPVEDIS